MPLSLLPLSSLWQQFQALDSLQQAFWACAAVASLVFVVQMVLTLVGMDTPHADLSAVDFGATDGDTMDAGGSVSLFSVRNLINFLLGFGWGGVCLRQAIPSDALLVAAAIAVGAAFVAMFFSVLKHLRRLETNGAFNIHTLLHQPATVYLRIPAQGQGKGKVQLSAGGAIHEIDALTDGEALPTGTPVTITEILDGHTLRVAKA